MMTFQSIFQYQHLATHSGFSTERFNGSKAAERSEALSLSICKYRPRTGATAQQMNCMTYSINRRLTYAYWHSDLFFFWQAVQSERPGLKMTPVGLENLPLVALNTPTVSFKVESQLLKYTTSAHPSSVAQAHVALCWHVNVAHCTLPSGCMHSHMLSPDKCHI